MKGLKEIAVNNFQAEIEIGHPFSKVTAPAFLEKVFSEKWQPDNSCLIVVNKVNRSIDLFKALKKFLKEI